VDIAEINKPASWVTSDFLMSIGFQLNIIIGLLVCMVCMKAWTPTNMHGHANLKHGAAKPTKVSRASLDALVAQYNILPKPKLHPAPSRVPIRGLKVHDGALVCRGPECNYTCLEKSSMQTHWAREHSRLTQTIPVAERCHSGRHAQSYYANLYNSYWEVDPQMADGASGDLYKSFVTDYMPLMDGDKPIQPPVTSRDIPPWLRLSGFLTYMGDHATDTEKRKDLVELMSRPRSKDVFYGNLHFWVFEYMSSIRADTSDVQYTFLRRILHGAGE
jgi:Orsellinic acid/F9775 biosynthesis cluster protein D